MRLLPWEQSIITESRSPFAASCAQTSLTRSASKFGPVRFPPRRITWQVAFPVVSKIADTPCFVTDGNQCGERADRTASTAVSVFPSVLFLNPTGIDSPDASSRCTWLSVVRAPIATQAVRSAMCCGICVSRNSDAVGSPRSLTSSRNLRASRSPLLMWKLPSRSGSLMSPFQPTEVRGFSK